jgi:putative endonuclease
MDEKAYYVYIMAKGRNSTFYTGVTSDLIKRVWQHKNDLADGFTKKYEIKNLVYYEVHMDVNEAIKREKQLKKWNRPWKMRLVETMNRNWNDLYNTIIGQEPDPRLCGEDTIGETL